MKTPTNPIQVSRRPTRPLVVQAIVMVLSIACVLVLLNRTVDALAGDRLLPQVPGSGPVVLIVLTAGILTCLVRGNLRTHRGVLATVGYAIAAVPALIAVGVVIWAALAWWTLIPLPLIASMLSLVIGSAVGQLILFFWRGDRPFQTKRAATSSGPTAVPRVTAPTEPSSGQVWWADVPFEENAESKERPVLVLDVGATYLTVLMFTSQEPRNFKNHVPAPATMWRTPKVSYLRLDRRIQLHKSAIRRYEADAPQHFLTQAGVRLQPSDSPLG